MAAKEDTIKELRAMFKREHDLLNDRSNFFLLAQSILLGCFVVVLPENRLIASIVALWGVLYSAMWMVITHHGYCAYVKIKDLVAEYEAKLEKEDRIYSLSSSFVSGEKNTPIVTLILARIIPMSWLVIWVSLVLLIIL